MFIAHLPAGYLLSQSLHRKLSRTDRLTILAGSVLPDIDLILFYFRDGQTTHHHSYVTHRPILWFVVIMAGLVFHQCHGKSLTVLGLAGLVHLILDTLCGAINWGWPIIDIRGPLIVVSATQAHWVVSFLTHWTFAIEVTVCGLALIVWYKSPKKNPGQ